MFAGCRRDRSHPTRNRRRTVLRTFECDFDGSRRPLEPAHALDAAARGVLVLLERRLEQVGYLDRFTELFLEEIAGVTTPAVADAVREAGLTRMHDHLNPDQVVALLARLDRRAAPLAVPFSQAIVRSITGTAAGPYFICSRMWVRAQIPYRLLEARSDILEATHLMGHLVPATPHRDFWLTHPRGTMSIWAAVGPVRERNTMMFFEGEEGGRTLTPGLDPGDVLVFNADRLHASVRNVTDETRVAVTSRIVPGRRLRYGPGTHWRPYYDARLLGTPFAPIATLQSRLSLAALRRWWWRRKWRQSGTSGPTTGYLPFVPGGR